MTSRFELFPLDIERAVDFYTTVLAFRLESDRRREAEPYASVRRDGVTIGLAPGFTEHRDCRRPPTGVEVVLEFDDLDAEFDSVRRAGGVVAEGLQERPWGLRDVRICDPDGYYLRITERRIG